MTRFGCAIAGLLLLTSASKAVAQEMLTLDGVVDAVLAGNARLRGVRAAGAEADARVAAARSGVFPRLTVTESWQRGDQPVFVFSSLLASRRFGAANLALDRLNHPDAVGFFRASVGIEQVLFDGGRTRSSWTAASQLLVAARASADETAADLVVMATRTFGRAVAAQAAGRAAAAGLAAAEDDLARAQHRRDAGTATDAEVLALSVHVADLQRRTIQARGDGAIARAELNRLMGSPVQREFRVTEPAGGRLDDGDDTDDLPALLAQADAARPELKRVAALQRAADAGGREARAALLPRAVAQAAVDVSGTRIIDRTSSWILGGELRWTVSSGGAERASRRAATQAAIRARAEADEARAAVHVEVVSAVRQLETARARQAAGRAAVEQAREAHRIVRNRFDAGMAGVGDVLRASTDLLDAEANSTSAAVDAIVGRALLQRAVGRIP